MDYADAVVEFIEAVSRACGQADRNGLTAKEQAEELRKIAKEVEAG